MDGFPGVIAAMLLISRKIKNDINENGIETDAVVSRITDGGTLGDVDFDVYVKYHPKYKNNARLL